MSVNFEVKGLLAKLLATEDLVVEHKADVITASFDVDKRILTLPMWDASNCVIDLLVAHECSHALYTPNVDWTEMCYASQSFVNIVEDVRVERFIKRRYDGLPKIFYKAYGELNESDFFKIKDQDISKLNLGDRVNLYYKIGSYVDVPFSSEEELRILKLVGDANTFDEVLRAAEVLYDYCKEESLKKSLEEDGKTEMKSENSNTSGNGNDVDGEMGKSNGEDNDTDYASGKKDSNESNEGSSKTSNEGNAGSEGTNGNIEPKLETNDNFEQSLRDMIDHSSQDNVYLGIPRLDLEHIIISNKDIHDMLENHWNYNQFEESVFSSVDSDYLKFKKSASKEVSYLVKEFECRKSADSYSRSSISNSGVLDCTKLHSYKYNEDIFKRVTTIPEGKNHGLVFILDWSGSMQSIMKDTIKQLYNLIWFCNRVSIPFDVYAFTNAYYYVDKQNETTPKIEKCANELDVYDRFHLMHLFTSKCKKPVIELQMKNINRVVESLSYRNTYTSNYTVPTCMNYGGTPLNESLLTLHEILPKFQKENKLQKVHCIILTDGEGYGLQYNIQTKSYGMGTRYLNPKNSYLRDRKLGRTYSFDGGYAHELHFTKVLLRHLRDKFPTVNFVGIRLIEQRDCSKFLRDYVDNICDRLSLQDEWKKNKSCTVTTSGYHKYFGISSRSLQNDIEVVVDDDATKLQIQRAFKKSLRSKKMNKKMLGEFIELIA